ncbi:unnamed protein product [Adineta steineri]|uniref:Uncharacterized protein n=1 Tax=Adineta steineri TaxID=433720 RepID=A0A820SJ67_9BILA|nr:unnamed protein product [Adineta steineri]
MNKLVQQFSSKYHLPLDATMDFMSCEISPDSDTEEKKNVHDHSLEISNNQNQFSAVDDEMGDIRESNHANITHQQQQQSNTMNSNGIKRTSNIDSPTTHKPKRTNNANQSTTRKPINPKPNL